MSNLNIGCNFSSDHVKAIIGLVTFQRDNGYPNRIARVYGSPGILNPFGSTRPRRREVDVTMSDYMDGIELLRDANVEITWTMNSLVPAFRDGASNYTDVVNWIQNSYNRYMFDSLIVSHPAIMDLLVSSTNNFGRVVRQPTLPVTISTIMNVHTIAHLKWIKKHWPNVISVCPALWRNRDTEWLARANEIIPLELLVNEFCTIGGIECEGLYRQSCYLAQCTDQTWNPMDVCRPSRFEHPEAWLKAKFILPDWIVAYTQKTGITRFKITGRTHPAEFIRNVGQMYITGKGSGNLLALWGQLEATYVNQGQNQIQKEMLQKYPNIPIEFLADKRYFLNPACSSDACSDTCEHCTRLYQQIIEGQKDGQQ